MNRKTHSYNSPVLNPIQERVQTAKTQTRNLSTASLDNPRLKSRIHLKSGSTNEYKSVNHPRGSLTGLSVDLNPLSLYLSENTVKQAFIKENVVEGLALGSPAGRKDVKILIEWLDAKLASIADEKKHQEPDELFEMVNEIYSSCLAEAIRQVSVHCKERGYLISRVWLAYKTLFEKTLRIANTRYKILQDKMFGEKHKLQRNLLQKIEDYAVKNQEVSKRNVDLSGKIEEYEKIIKEKSEKEETIVDKIGLLQGRYKNLKFELLQYREENRILRIKYENISLDEIKATKKRCIAPKKFKTKSSRDFLKKIKEDPMLNLSNYESKDLSKEIYKYGII